jgi:probable rRNA maturation factor
MVTIQVKRPVRLPIDKLILLAAAQATLEFVRPGQQPDVSLVVGNDALLQSLNRQYRGVDTSTDVLSFPSGEIDPDTARVYLGDVIISLTRAQDQAISAGHSLADELQLLVVHGVLHLLGYDHEKPADKKQMQAAQDKILKSLGLGLTITL